MNDDPADERASSRRKLTLSRELEVPRQILLNSKFSVSSESKVKGRRNRIRQSSLKMKYDKDEI